MRTLQSFPINFLDSWQYKKIQTLYGVHIARQCAVTLLRMYQHAAEHSVTSAMSEECMMELAQACRPEVKGRVLWAMYQANLLRRVEGGYVVWALQPLPTNLARRQPTEQMTLGLVASHDGSGSRPARDWPALDADALAAEVDKIEQNQAVSLARACAMSATQGDDAPLIDPASTHTEFLQAPNGERSEAVEAHSAQARVLLPCLLSLESEAKKAAPTGAEQGVAVERGVSSDVVGLGGGLDSGRLSVSLPKAASRAEERCLRLVESTVVRTFVPPSRFIRRTKSVNRVKRQIVAPCQSESNQQVIAGIPDISGQQNALKCREPTSAARAGQLLEESPPMLKLTETAIHALIAGSRLWPCKRLKAEHVEWIMQQGYTVDDINEALAHFRTQKDNGSLMAYWPSVLCKQLQQARAMMADMQQGERAQRKGKGQASGEPGGAKGGPKTQARDRKRRQLESYLTSKLRVHWPIADALADCMVCVEDDVLVSLYVEMGEPDWRDVSEAFAEGRRPQQLGLMPSQPCRDAMDNDEAEFSEAYVMKLMGNVQTGFDNRRMTG